jgi:hypothetical protein
VEGDITVYGEVTSCGGYVEGDIMCDIALSSPRQMHADDFDPVAMLRFQMWSLQWILGREDFQTKGWTLVEDLDDFRCVQSCVREGRQVWSLC